MDDTAEAQIKSVYKSFSDAYTKLDSWGIANTYSETGVEVYLITGAPPAMIYGREAIQKGIENFFAQVRERGHRLSVIFRIVSRKFHDQQAFDTGFYQVSILDKGEIVHKQYGKIAITLKQNLSCDWEYLYDANGTATQEEFENAVPIPDGEIL